MAVRRISRTSRWKHFAVGAVLTALLAAGYMSSPQWARESLESRPRDILLWGLKPARAVSPEVTIVEIDDAALAEIGHWPWDWRDLAGIVDSLNALGARTIVLDIFFTEAPGLQPPEGAAADQSVQLCDPVPPLVEAVRNSGRVVLAYSAAIGHGQRITDPHYAAIESALTARPGLTPAELAAQLGVGREEIEKFYGTALRRALEVRLAAEPLQKTDDPAVGKLLARIFPDLEHSSLATTQKNIFLGAMEFSRRRAILETCGAAPGIFAKSPGGAIGEATRLEPPLADLTRAAAGLGFANIVPDSDGVVRKIPLLVRQSGRVYPQLALRTAMLAGGYREIVPDRGQKIVLRAVDGHELEVPVDADGNLVINWSQPVAGRPDGLRHLSIRPVNAHYRHRLLDRRYEEAMTFAARLLPGVAPGRPALLAEIKRLTVAGAPENVRRESKEKELAALDEKLALELVTLLRDKPAGISAEDLRRAGEEVEFLQAAGDNPRAVRDELAALEARLSDSVRDRVCLVGVTATSAALDQKATPISRAYPGVGAQATVVENLLSGRFATEAAPGLNLALLAALGLAVTLLAGLLPTMRATAATLALLVGYWGCCWLLLDRAGLLAPLAGPVVTGLFVLLGVMTYRELTEGRNRRWITEVFKQYTSDQMVEEVVANPDFLALGGDRREMTVYFSDIAGFTAICERLDPPTLVRFLQTYLEQMTDRILEQGGTLDKYEGDAIIAFFGAPVVLGDHATRCLRAGLAHLRALPAIDRELHEAQLLPEGLHLGVRIGISTGSMVVGNFGSSRRFEYTVIGDAVNVGARLEGACRFFGTTVLVSRATRDQALGRGASGEEFLLRRIGPVRFVGKAEAVEVWELLDGASPGSGDGLGDYQAAVAAFEQGCYEQARDHFLRVQQLRPGDGPTAAYLTRLETLRREGRHEPPGPWDMTSK